MRRHEVTRLEAFSDAVFGFALTLLVVSLEVPTSYDELMRSMAAVPAFAASFTALLLIWYEHQRFFRTYGLQDPLTIWINSALLFVVLLYVYPLKFLATALIGPNGLFLGGHPCNLGLTRVGQMSSLMMLYGAGFVAVFGLMALLYLQAWRTRSHIGLDAAQGRGAVVQAGACGVYVAVGLCSMLLAFFDQPALAGFS